MPRPAPKTDSGTNLLEAALSMSRAKRDPATPVDELCAAAGVTEGAFFLARATGGAEIAADSINHLRSNVEMLFGVGTEQPEHLTGGGPI